jgi:hypothetical protein
MYSANSFENEVFSKLTENRNLYDPLVITEVLQESIINSNSSNIRADGVIRFDYLEQKLNLLIEIKNRTAPQIVERGIAVLKSLMFSTDDKEYIPALVVPYLSPPVVERLKSGKFSGLDLNGNYYIVTDNIIAIRLDKKNQYKETAYIKDVYAKNSSIIGRFLLRENFTYQKVSDIYNGINELGGKITLSTVSKVLTVLQEQLILSKDKEGIKLIQPVKLLSNLRMGYRAPAVSKTLLLNLPQTRQEAKDIFVKYFSDRWIWSGESSAEFYASTTLASQFTVYCKSSEIPQDFMNKYVDEKFYNYTFHIIPKSEEYILFDSQNNIASRLQTYLELSQLDKREKEIAQDIEKDILSGFDR